MPDSPCLARLRRVSDAIDARTEGRQVANAGGKGRSVGYANSSLADMVRLYRQLWLACPDAAASDLPLLAELDASTATRGTIRLRPVR